MQYVRTTWEMQICKYGHVCSAEGVDAVCVCVQGRAHMLCLPLREVKGGDFRLQRRDVIQVYPVRTQVLATLLWTHRERADSVLIRIIMHYYTALLNA